MQILAKQFSAPSHRFIPLQSKYSTQRSVLKHTLFMMNTSVEVHSSSYLYSTSQYMIRLNWLSPGVRLLRLRELFSPPPCTYSRKFNQRNSTCSILWDIGAIQFVCNPTFRRNILPRYSGLKISQLKISIKLVARQNDSFLRNVGSHTDYKALYPRGWWSS
jgi:hypothetical protein